MADLGRFQKRVKELVAELETKNKTLIAKELGIAYVTFSKVYNHGIIPDVSILVRLADFFDISVEYLLGNTDNDYFQKSDSPKFFSDRLQELKRRKKIRSYYDLADKVHIHRNNISQWRKKNYIPRLSDLEILADFFDVSIDYLLGRTDDDTPYRD